MRKKLNLWMLAAILILATIFSSCTDNIDNSGSIVSEPVETAKQVQFWSKFEKWQNATTMEQAMEAWGRATAAGYNSLFSPVVKVVTGKAAWVMDKGMPIYYDYSALSLLSRKEGLDRHRAYRGGQPTAPV